MNTKKHAILTLAALFITAFTPAFSATIVHYQETFSGFTSGNQSYSQFGWSAHAGPNATDRSSNTATNSNDGLFVSSTVNGPDGNPGIAAKTVADSQRVAIAWTNEFTPLATGLLDSFTFATRNNDVADVQHFAIRIDTAWFASAETFNNPTGLATWTPQSLDFTTAAANWRSLTFTPGSALSLGSLLNDPLPVGNLTAIGLFNPAGQAGTYRFDDVTIHAIPEPSSVVLVLGALVLSLAMLRRRG